MDFKKWLTLQEVGTGTNSVAVFSRSIFSRPVTRWPWNQEDPFFKKKRLKEGSPVIATQSPVQTLPQGDAPDLKIKLQKKSQKSQKKH